MKLKDMNITYLPIDPDFYETIENEKSKQDIQTVHYFDKNQKVLKVKNRMIKIIRTNKNEEYLLMGSGEQVRLDRVIVMNGKPGAAFDEYDSYALDCLDCNGGMEL